jgi:TP901 family phage tail tape measure protein
VAFLPGVGGTSIGQALIRISADTSRMKAEMAAMNGQLKGEMAATGQAVKGQSAMMGAAFQAVKIGIIGMGAGFAMFAVDAVKATAAFDKAMAKVYALTGQTAKQMEDLRKQVLDLSTAVPQSATKLAEGLYYVISAGFTAGDALKVLKVAAMDATVGLTDTQTVADGLTSAMNAYGYSADQATHVSDIMTAAVTAGKMEWSQLASSIGAAAVQGATAGVSLEEVTSAIATMTRSGLTAARSSFGVATLIKALGNPNAGALKEMKALGITYDQNTLKQKGLIGTLKLLSDAAGKHTDVIVKLKNGNIDAEKSAAATAAANKGYAANLQAMTGNARGFLAAQILLSQGSKFYNEIYAGSKHASDGIGLTTDAFNKFSEADPGVQFQLLINKVQAAAIGFGTTLMPQLAKFLTFLTDLLPRGMKVIGDIWNNTLQPVFAEMFDAVGKLIVSIAGIFSGGEKAASGGDAIKTILQGIADVIATVVRTGSLVATALAGLFSNPIVAGLTKVLGIFLILKATVGGILGIGGSLAGAFKGMAKTLSGGFLFKETATPEATAASALKAGGEAAAVAMKEGGAALSKEVAAAGAAFRAEALGLPAGAINAGRGTLIAGAGAALPAGVPLAVGTSAAEKAAYEASLLGVRGRIQQAGTNAVTTLKNGLTTVGSKISGFLGGAANLIMPLMVAGIAASFLQGPVGQWVASNPKFQRAGEKMQTDLVGGVIDLFTKSLEGADAAIGHAETMVIGKATFSTMALAKIGITSATFDKLEAPVGTIDHAQGAKAFLDTLTTRLAPGGDLAQKAGELTADYYNRIKDALDQGVRDGAKQFFGAPIVDTTGTSAPGKVDTAGLAAYLQKALGTQVTDLVKGTRDAYVAALSPDLLGRGFTVGQISQLDTSQLDTISGIAAINTSGNLNFLNDYLMRKYTGAIRPATPKVKPGLGPEDRGGPDPAWLAEQMYGAGSNAELGQLATNTKTAMNAWWKNVSSVEANALKGFVSDIKTGPTGIDPAVQVALQKRFGQDWLGAMHAGTAGIVITSSADTKGAAAALGTGWKAIVAQFSRTASATSAQAIEDAGKVKPGTIAALKNKFGDQWLTVLHGLTGGVADASVVAEFKRYFGVHWRDALTQAGLEVWSSEGGADADALKKAMKARIASAIASLTPKDLTPVLPKTGPGAEKPVTTLTAAQVKAQQAAVTSAMNTAMNKGIIDALSSPDAATAKQAVKDLGTTLSKSIPDAAARTRFIDTIKAMQGIAAIPDSNFMQTLNDQLPGVATSALLLADAMTGQLGPAMDYVKGKAKTFLSGLPGVGGGVDSTGRRTGSTGRAGGGFLSAKQPSWVGEGGGYRELFVPGMQGGVVPHNVSEFIAALVPNMGSLVAAVAASGGGGRGGSQQSISIDRMSLYNARDEQDVVERMAFLMPNGR